MIGVIKSFLSPYMWWVVLGAFVLGGLAIWQVRSVMDDAASADRFRAMLDARVAGEQFGFEQSMNLETNLNDYRARSRELDREVYDATIHDSGNRFTAGSVQRTAGRIAAGKAARKRAH